MVEDAHAMFKYVAESARRAAPDGKLVLWGHSLGTGIAVQLVANLVKDR